MNMDDENETSNNAVALAAQTGMGITADVYGPMPVALALFLNDALYERVSHVAGRMSKAEGITPRHLIGKPEACFAIVGRSITWRLDPFAVACSTYQTPGGQIGFEGKLIHAIIENSGKLIGGIEYEHYGDWSKVQGRFVIKESGKQDGDGKPRKYAAATWTDDDARAGKPADQTTYPFAQSCGVRIIAHIRGEKKPRILDFDLIQAQPRNSTLWALDPRTQICYTAVRRFGSVAVPSLLMGVPFDPGDTFPSAPIDVTPTPTAAPIDDINANIVAAKSAQNPPPPATAPTPPTPAPGAPMTTKAPITLYAEVRTAIEKAANPDALNLARDLIRNSPPQFHAELTGIADARMAELQPDLYA
jgi:hypothetical protein